VLAIDKRRVEENAVTVTLRLDQEPYEAGVDPLRKLIDKKPRDNTKRVKLM